MRLEDEIRTKRTAFSFDENMNVKEEALSSFKGKCKVLPNSSAQQIVCNDGSVYVYSYTIFLKLPLMSVIDGAKDASATIQEGDVVEIFHKLSGKTTEQRVKGVTYLPKKYLKIYV